MDKKVVLITGASNGIGAEIAKLFAKDGYYVAINYNKSEENAKKLECELCSQGHNVLAIHADVSNYQEVEAMISQVIKTFGHIDVLINNAGICSSKMIIDEDEKSINNVLNTNLLGTIYASKFAAQHMVSRNIGNIINMSSIWGIYGASMESVYSASKGGIIAFTKALAKELAYSNIRVNCIAPGVVDTNMMNGYSESEKNELLHEIPLGRFASPTDIANLALFLASNKSIYIHGQVIEIDGGFCL